MLTLMYFYFINTKYLTKAAFIWSDNSKKE